MSQDLYLKFNSPDIDLAANQCHNRTYHKCGFFFLGALQLNILSPLAPY